MKSKIELLVQTMYRLITLTIKFWLHEGGREITEFRRLGVAKDPRDTTDDPNNVLLRTGHEGEERE